MVVPAIIIALVVVGWFPFFYLRFRRDGKGRALLRGALWGLFMIVPAFVISELTYALPAPLAYPLVFLGAPVLLNVCALLSYILHSSERAS